MCSPIMKTSKYMTLRPSYIPRGCYKEIRKYQQCAAKNSSEACFSDKISIMEVCPDHVLEGLREKKKWYLRAEMIDNDTYKRAMVVSDFNKGRSVTDLTIKSWEHGKACNMRSDSYFQDDRYNPTKFSHAHRNDNVNFPEQEYKDFFGGTIGTGDVAECEKNRLNLVDGQSVAINQHMAEKRKQKLKDVVGVVNDLNKK